MLPEHLSEHHDIPNLLILERNRDLLISWHCELSDHLEERRVVTGIALVEKPASFTLGMGAFFGETCRGEQIEDLFVLIDSVIGSVGVR
jgi:hypothetical protein